MNFDISSAGRRFLLQTARESIKAHLHKEEYILAEIPEELGFAGGCFVTLHIRGRLRGCIGNFRDDVNIAENVSDMAVQAAFSDPRFGPLSKDELLICDIEISVLSPMMKATAEEITIGRDGIYIIKGFNRGVLLPQVAIEHNWNRETFLEQTCLKAGLSKEIWKEPDTQIMRFEAIVFGENNPV